jgi:hypothetical protein
VPSLWGGISVYRGLAHAQADTRGGSKDGFSPGIDTSATCASRDCRRPDQKQTEPVNTNKERKKHEVSVARTIEALEGKLALLATLENSQKVQPEYLHEVRRKCTKLRAQLVNKNALPVWL